MERLIYFTHLLSVVLFVVLYLTKTILFLTNSRQKLAQIGSITRVPERIIAFLLLSTGGYLLTQIPHINLYMVIKLACVTAAIPLAIIGFKKEIKALPALSLILLVSAFGLAGVSKRKVVQGTISETSTINGKALYTAGCAQCHGEDGKRGVMGAADLSTTLLDLTKIMTTVKNGKGAMAGYKELLADDQIKAVAEYVQTLKK